MDDFHLFITHPFPTISPLNSFSHFPNDQIFFSFFKETLLQFCLCLIFNSHWKWNVVVFSDSMVRFSCWLLIQHPTFHFFFWQLNDTNTTFWFVYLFVIFRPPLGFLRLNTKSDFIQTKLALKMNVLKSIKLSNRFSILLQSFFSRPFCKKPKTLKHAEITKFCTSNFSFKYLELISSYSNFYIVFLL